MSSITENHEKNDPTRAVYGSACAPPSRTLIELFSATVTEFPDAVALESAAETLTYRSLSMRVNEVATALWEAGVRRGDRVGIRMPSGSVDLYIAILAVLHAGAAYVPVDWDDPDERAETVFSEAAVSAVVGEHLAITRHLPLEPFAEAPPLEHASPSTADDAWVIFTSGSTGKPKGVAVSHRAAAALVDAEAALYLQAQPLGPGDRVMAGLSVAFDASCEEMWLAWRSGAALISAPRDVVRSGPDLGDWIVANRITAVSTVPTLASLWPIASLDNVRLLIFGGEACPLDLIVRLERSDREIWNTYGPTETTVIACGAIMTPTPPVRIGKPISGWKLAVIDQVTERPVAWGEKGELVISGVGMGRYLDPQKDAEKYAPLPSLGWERAYRTGDIVLADQEGLVFVGRTDDQIKLGGKRIELGEIDDHLAQMPGVNAGAAALHQTNAGSEVLVGYLTQAPGQHIDVATVQSLMAQRLPGGVVPVLAIVDELPMKTSGKVDRGALPWPLAHDEGDQTDLTATESWLKGLWIDQLGPLPIGTRTSFFEIGGGSVQVARLMANIRDVHPSAEIRELYANPTLTAMAAYIDGLDLVTTSRSMPTSLPIAPRIFQVAFIGAVYLLNAVRYIVALVAVVWVLDTFFYAGWVPHVPFLPVLIAWVLIFSTPGRVLQAAIVARVLTMGLRPGSYRRGGWTHVRVWAAERFLHFLRLDQVCGSSFSRTFHRLMGNRVGARCHLACLPPVSGLATIGDDVTIEYEADLSGYWIEGDIVHIGTVTVADGARIGTRSILSPGVEVGAHAEVLPGSHVDRNIRAGELWGGSPIRYEGDAGASWPPPQGRTSGRDVWRRGKVMLAESVGLAIITFLPALAVVPGAVIVLPQVIHLRQFEKVALVLAAWAPLASVLIVLTWLASVIILVRVLATWIRPGYFPEDSAAGRAVWLTQTLLRRTLASAYPLYASVATPWFLRLLGARVGRDTEVSTIETIPHLTWLQDRTFIADHALVTSTRHRQGWVHIGTVVIGEGTFIGNSAIVGPDIDLPPDALVAVLSTSPRRAPAGSSWLGRPAEPIPRTVYSAAETATYYPSSWLKGARSTVEALRMLPFIINTWIELGMVVVLNAIYMDALFSNGNRLSALGITTAFAFPLAVFAGVGATLIAVAAKWVLLGRFKEGDCPLFNSFVWRNELADVFAESLAVPSIIRLSIGSPIFNMYARAMGARIGRDVWCETWWLPEFDLISIGDRATINHGTVLQTHLFQDRVMALSRTEMQRGSTLGVNSFMLPGSNIGERAVVGVASLVLRDEQLPADTYWQGNPVQFVPPEQPTARGLERRHESSQESMREAKGATSRQETT